MSALATAPPTREAMPSITRPADVGAYDHVYLSPHPDDVVLACGGGIAAAVAAGSRVLVVTVCTAVPTPEVEVAAFGGPAPRWARWPARRAEDVAALGALGVDWLWLDELDAPLRLPASYAGGRRVFAPPAARDPLAAHLRAHLRDLAGLSATARLHAPLGIGGHVDHRLCQQAAQESCEAWGGLSYYEDFPYVAQTPGGAARRRQELGLPLHAVVRPIGPFLEAKVMAAAAYRSQLEMLFGSDDGLVRSLVGWSRRVAGGRGAAEREWAPEAD